MAGKPWNGSALVYSLDDRRTIQIGILGELSAGATEIYDRPNDAKADPVAGMTADGYGQALHGTWVGGRPDLVSGYVSLLRPIVDAGIKVEVILDNPYPLVSVPDCVEMNGAESPKCQLNQPDVARPADPLGEVAAKIPGVGVIELHDNFCTGGTCPAVIGNVRVYRDNHMTNTFAKTLTGPLEAGLGF